MGKLIEARFASLKPSDATGEQEVEVEVARMPPLEVGIRNQWEPNDELKSDKIEHCLPIVRWNLIDIADQLGISQPDVARYAVHFGIRRLFQLRASPRYARYAASSCTTPKIRNTWVVRFRQF